MAMERKPGEKKVWSVLEKKEKSLGLYSQSFLFLELYLFLEFF